MLNQHPDIFIADKELHFFDCDNPLQHPDFNTFNKGEWHSRSLTKANYKQYWLWYAQQFAAAKVNQKNGGRLYHLFSLATSSQADSSAR
jgi:hypothetical protein